MKCPSCGSGGSFNFRCDTCGENRCSGNCGGTTGKNGGAAIRGMCKACKKGKYEKV